MLAGHRAITQCSITLVEASDDYEKPRATLRGAHSDVAYAQNEANDACPRQMTRSRQ